MCLLVYGPRHARTCLRAYTDSEGPDQPAHPETAPSLSAIESVDKIKCIKRKEMPG